MLIFQPSKMEPISVIKIDQILSELNEKINSISFRDPTKLNPWRHFNKKRKLEDDQDFIKNPRPVKKIILQPRITNTRVRKGFHWCFILLSDWSSAISQWNLIKSSPKSSPRSVRHRSSNPTQPSIREFYKPKNWVIAISLSHLSMSHILWRNEKNWNPKPH